MFGILRLSFICRCLYEHLESDSVIIVCGNFCSTDGYCVLGGCLMCIYNVVYSIADILLYTM